MSDAMPAPHPASLKLQSVYAAPLIQLKYDNDPDGLGLPGQTWSNRPINDDWVFPIGHFHQAYRVGDLQVSAVQDLSAETFAGLCQAMGFVSYLTEIRSKERLSAIAKSESKYIQIFGAEPGLASLERIEAVIMAGADVNRVIDWQVIARLYNTSDETQQKAILAYFAHIENRDLVDLFDVQEPEIVLPASLKETFESRTITGDTYITCPVQNLMVREDLFMTQYRVTMTDVENYECLMFSAPTLSLAMAKGITYIKDPANGRYSSMRLWHEENLLAEGSLFTNLFGVVQYAAKMDWILERHMTVESFYEKHRVVEKAALKSTPPRVRDLDDGMSP
jgi:hypothetical protein